MPAAYPPLRPAAITDAHGATSPTTVAVPSVESLSTITTRQLGTDASAAGRAASSDPMTSALLYVTQINTTSAGEAASKTRPCGAGSGVTIEPAVPPLSGRVGAASTTCVANRSRRGGRPKPTAGPPHSAGAGPSSPQPFGHR